MYTAPLNDIIRSHGVNAVYYADDTQIYIVFKRTERDNYIHLLNACIADIRDWSARNSLSLNDNKTEIIHFTSKFLSDSFLVNIDVGEDRLQPISQARNLGVIFDQHLTMREHIKYMCRAAMAAIRCIGQIRSFLSKQATTVLIHAFVTSRLDSCNSLLSGLPRTDIQRLQMIQNTAARLVTRTPRFQSISPILKSLHWLPVEKRIMFKLCLLTFKALQGTAPAYLSNLLSDYNPNRTLRSSSQSLLKTPKINTEYYGSRSFSYAAPTLWNNLPFNIRQITNLNSFKTSLKSYLFKL